MRRIGDDEGVALITVMGAMVVLTTFALGALAFALQGAPMSRKAQDSVTALAAAQAGIDDYISRLNVNPTYYGVNSTGVDPANLAFSSGAPVPGSASASFRYRLLTTPTETARTGFIRLQSTGTSRGVSKTLTGKLAQPGFVNYVYYTDVEALDPIFWRTDQVQASVNGSAGYVAGGEVHRYYASQDKVAEICTRRYYEGRSSPAYTSSTSAPYVDHNQTTGTSVNRTSGATVRFSCSEIQFTGNDTIQGPLHSNDALQVNGATNFTDRQTETSWSDTATPAPPADRRWWGGASSLAGYRPVYAPPLSLPSTNTQLVSHAASSEGCTYKGETRITFVGASMKVLSPQTTAAPSRCLNTANRDVEQIVTVPSVIYVDDSTSSCVSGAGYPMPDEDATSPTLPVPYASNPQSRRTTSYNCQYGNAFVSGTLKAQVTVATKRDIVVVGDIRYQDGTLGSDVLGLIPNGSAWVYNPVNSAGANLLSEAASVHRIDAAILTVQHSFLVQNWNLGTSRSPSAADSDKLTVNGAIAQRARGPVGTGTGTAATTGYLKNYVYDSRLRYLPPPYFLAPESAPYELVQLSQG
jgi:hypothetical protein